MDFQKVRFLIAEYPHLDLILKSQKKVSYLFLLNQVEIMEYDKNSEVYSKVVRAGKRTYFFDVKATKSDDLYLTITESKKTTIDGRESYQKHKIFLYKEDFEKFQEGLEDALDKIDRINAGEHVETYSSEEAVSNESSVDQYSEVSFDDL